MTDGARGAPRGCRAVLFDMDGVLLDSREAWCGLVQAAGLALAGRAISRDEFDATWGQGVAADVERFFPGRTEEEVARFYLDHFVEHAASLRVDPESRPLLEALRGRGLRVAVVTNTPGELARRTLAAAGLEPETVVGADEVARAKPAPDIVHEACSRLGVRPAEALVVGDSRYDREAAAAAGASFVGVGAAGGDVTIARLGALLRLLPDTPPRPEAARRLGEGRLVRGAALAAFAIACGIAGFALRDLRRAADGDYEIRRGHRHLVNPLLDCEISGYQRGRELRPFRDQIDALVAKLVEQRKADRVSVYFSDLDNGPWFGLREEETFAPSSLLKVPLAMAALAEGEREPGFLDRQVRFYGFPGGLPRGGYVPEDTLVVGRTYTVGDLVRRTAANSDNAAVALLGQQLDAQLVSRVFADLGLPPEYAVLKGPAALSARTYGHLFRILYNASYLGPEASDRALTHLAESTFSRGLVGGVPAGTVVAHMFGIHAVPWQKGAAQLHDCGIVYHPARPYFLCVMTEGGDVDRLAGGIREISRAVHEEVSRQAAEPGPFAKPASPFGG
jgi:phosphoglycolate phosphatase/AHBA synthesis associated protein